ncbi:hypothetical protein RFI_16157 [Reticulomyxa filosa]|uniref:Uncharacterized protein n=1 Tax=Reticulomyxa filosa TaxID=46433 RepID=X6N6W6_RETFI|nr:hypothetical protein RFI_16157 [Reticulomyxa filosa]|eukprot:ETO21047.1 hypothetical protein RFI_16157 [Reticulomyxa filosa]
MFELEQTVDTESNASEQFNDKQASNGHFSSTQLSHNDSGVSNQSQRLLPVIPETPQLRPGDPMDADKAEAEAEAETEAEAGDEDDGDIVAIPSHPDIIDDVPKDVVEDEFAIRGSLSEGRNSFSTDSFVSSHFGEQSLSAGRSRGAAMMYQKQKFY